MKPEQISQHTPSRRRDATRRGILRTAVRGVGRLAATGLALATFGVSPVLANAVYDASLGAPECATPGSSCDSGALLERAGSMFPAESNHPNTVDGCLDGTSSEYYQVDESIERIVVSTLDGDDMASGATVRVDVTFFPYGSGSSDTLILSFTGDGENSSATLQPLATFAVTAGGMQTRSFTYTLPEGGVQRVRARLADNSYLTRCDGYGYYDVDELVFAVDPARSWANPWTIPVSSRADERECGGFENAQAWPPPSGVASARPELVGGTQFVQESPGVLVSQDGAYLWGGFVCGGYCTVDPNDGTNAGCSFLEQRIDSATVRNLWLDPFFTEGYTDIGDRAFYEELFAYAMGDDFHQPRGIQGWSKQAMTSFLLDVVAGTEGGLILQPVSFASSILEGRKAAFLFDDYRALIAFGVPDDGSASSQALYLEQLGHLLNWARCSKLGAQVGSDEACPTAQGGSAGARFRDAVMRMNGSRDVAMLRDVLPSLHPRRQAVATPDRYDLGGQLTILGDGQSSMIPIHVIDSEAGHKGTYTRSAVRELLAADGSARGLFDFLEQEHGLDAPTFSYRGESTSPLWRFVTNNGEFEVWYWLPPDTSPNSVEAGEFWYVVAQTLVDTIQGRLTGNDRCQVGGNYVHVVLPDDPLDLAAQTDACIHRDTLTHAIAGSLVHQHDFDHGDEELMAQLFDEIYTRDHPDISQRARHMKSACAILSTDGTIMTCGSTTTVHEKYNISGSEGDVVAHVRNQTRACSNNDDHLEDKECMALPADDFCVVYRWDATADAWRTEARACTEYHRIACQKAVDRGEGTTPAGLPYVETLRTDLQLTLGSYQLDFADEACALEFDRGEDAQGHGYIWTAAWLPAMPPVSAAANETVGSGGASCTSGTKRGCETRTTTVSNGGSDETAGRKRFKKSIQNAIRYGQTPTITRTSDPKQEVLRVHSINVGNGSCNLLQCLRFEGITEMPSVVENALIDCGSIPGGAANRVLDLAGVVEYLKDAHFYSPVARTPLFFVSHADRDHFSHIPGIINQPSGPGNAFNSWSQDDLAFVLGGWPEEYVGSYAARSRAQQDATALRQPNQDRDRARMRALLQDPNGGGRWVNSQLVGTDPATLVQEMVNAILPNPAFPASILDYSSVGGSSEEQGFQGFSHCQDFKLELVEVNTPPGGTNTSNQRSVRKNRASAVLRATFEPPQGDSLLTVLPGDALSATETAALAKMNPGQWNRRLLMASHHGSERHGSNSPGWLAGISPTRAFYSAGIAHYQHPNIDIVRYHFEPVLPQTLPTPPHYIVVGNPDNDYVTHTNFPTSKNHHGTINHGSLVYDAVIPIDSSGVAQDPIYHFSRKGPVPLMPPNL